ncbi:Hypothetical predicted protein [Marmota monax]|uniref:Kinesin motor domain-containing protein n=1 Tax=Marmota monax TaxID=9995 RepID=A0A5E4ASK3_MARMO|nr:Hypothetical predicted protein [Marmota monax]
MTMICCTEAAPEVGHGSCVQGGRGELYKEQVQALSGQAHHRPDNGQTLFCSMPSHQVAGPSPAQGSPALREMEPKDQQLMVALRIRPLNAAELEEGATVIAHKVGDQVVVLMDPNEDPEDPLRAHRSRERTFIFDTVFDQHASQEDVYCATIQHLVEGVISGYNATVFAYGPSGAGKTHTMLGMDAEPGIYLQTLTDLFQAIEKTRDNMDYSVSISYLEIYNEVIRDLLNPSSGFLDLREDSKGSIQIAGITEVSTSNAQEVVVLMDPNEDPEDPLRAHRSRERTFIFDTVFDQHASQEDVYCATIQHLVEGVISGYNATVFAYGPSGAGKTHTMLGMDAEPGIYLQTLTDLFQAIEKTRDNMDYSVSISYLEIYNEVIRDLLNPSSGFLDLREDSKGSIQIAGITEVSTSNAQETQNRGKRMKEGAHINRSLLALGNCINALSEKGGTRAQYVNFRNSKLTRLLKVKRNLLNVSYRIAQYTDVISDLRREIEHLKSKIEKQEKKKSESGIPDVQGSMSVGLVPPAGLSGFVPRHGSVASIPDHQTHSFS